MRAAARSGGWSARGRCSPRAARARTGTGATTTAARPPPACTSCACARGSRNAARGSSFCADSRYDGRVIRILLVLVCVLSTSCGGPLNFTHPEQPRYVGHPLREAPPVPDSLQVVAFNIKFAIEIDGSIELFRTDPAMRTADIILLQEMDVPGTRKIAHALGMHYVYYPATINPQTDRAFGNAILSR